MSGTRATSGGHCVLRSPMTPFLKFLSDYSPMVNLGGTPTFRQVSSQSRSPHSVRWGRKRSGMSFRPRPGGPCRRHRHAFGRRPLRSVAGERRKELLKENLLLFNRLLSCLSRALLGTGRSRHTNTLGNAESTSRGMWAPFPRANANTASRDGENRWSPFEAAGAGY